MLKFALVKMSDMPRVWVWVLFGVEMDSQPEQQIDT
jgi:hypothetical protein